MKITEFEEGGATILRFEGKLDTGTAPEAERRLEESLEKKPDLLLVDFEDLDFITSAGLRVLLAAAKKLQKGGGGKVHFCNFNETVAEIFRMSGFDMIFSIYDSKEEALETG